jgi:DNA-binding GntR family transcriptional regulator
MLTKTPATKNRLQVEKGDTLANVLRREIAEKILEGVLKPGSKLDERTLAQEFSVSRTPVREALQQLVSAGLAVSRPHAGTVVHGIDADRIAELCEASLLLETMCIRLAAVRMTSIDIGHLSKIFEACEACHLAGDASGYALENRKFHSTIIKATRNKDLADTVEFCRLRIAPFQRAPFKSFDRREASQLEHKAIIEALKQRDENLAAEAMTLHLSNAAVAIDEYFLGLEQSEDA